MIIRKKKNLSLEGGYTSTGGCSSGVGEAQSQSPSLSSLSMVCMMPILCLACCMCSVNSDSPQEKKSVLPKKCESRHKKHIWVSLEKCEPLMFFQRRPVILLRRRHSSRPSTFGSTFIKILYIKGILLPKERLNIPGLMIS